MGDPEVVYHEYIALLPTVEHHVIPHRVTNMTNSFVWNGRPIAIAAVHTEGQISRGWFEANVEEANRPQHPGVEQLLESILLDAQLYTR